MTEVVEDLYLLKRKGVFTTQGVIVTRNLGLDNQNCVPFVRKGGEVGNLTL